ncbi:hypothetical protein [Streptomyces sp. NPDC060035]|uniref:hypothetical protein n=1 Tax=Streptomyces sp. NPDC060035 TaxID=3347044 RepID=UPI0036A0814B
MSQVLEGVALPAIDGPGDQELDSSPPALGRIVETGTREQIFDAPRHRHTRTPLESVPRFRPGAAAS